MARFRTPPELNAPPVAEPAAARVAVGNVLEVSSYDRVAALLVALLIILGAAVFMMFVVWISGRVWVKQAALAPQLIEPTSGGGNALGSARDLIEPGEADIEEILEPQLADTLDAVTDSLSNQLATLDALGGESPLTAAGGGAGDRRQVGEGGDSDVIPRWQRWEILFSVSNAKTYARQLDFFKIELGAAGGSDKIDYAWGFSTPPPHRRAGPSSDEHRLYMTWRYGPLKQADEELLNTAKIKTRGRILMQFISPEVENQLATLEAEFMNARNHNLLQISKTVFRVVGGDGQYRFEVKDQRTRTAP